MTDLSIAKALAQAWFDSGVEAGTGITDRAVWPRGAPHCIEATKIALRCLTRLGVTASPLPCGFMVLNSLARAQIEADVAVKHWPAEAWTIGIDPDRQLPGDGWDGHLIVEGDGWVADYGAAQFARPGKIDISAWAASYGDWDHQSRLTLTGDDLHILIDPRRELAKWRNGSAWRSERGLGAVIERILEHVTLPDDQPDAEDPSLAARSNESPLAAFLETRQ